MGVSAADLGHIPMSPNLSATLARSSELAGAAGVAEVSLEHLLAALCDDPDAIAVLDASHITIERLKADVAARVLHGAPASHGPRGGFSVSQDVRRILEAAVAAARGSRRRDINGAIVLAAIVGDARSVAAEILEAHGLTFENAIRALQTALSAPREVPASAPVADDVLARARERVQSRSAPSLREIMKDLPRPAPPPPSVRPTIEPKPELPAQVAGPESSFPFPPQPAQPVANPPLSPVAEEPVQEAAKSFSNAAGAEVSEAAAPPADVPSRNQVDMDQRPVPAEPTLPLPKFPAASAAPEGPALPFPGRAGPAPSGDTHAPFGPGQQQPPRRAAAQAEDVGGAAMPVPDILASIARGRPVPISAAAHSSRGAASNRATTTKDPFAPWIPRACPAAGAPV